MAGSKVMTVPGITPICLKINLFTGKVLLLRAVNYFFR
jgi:hypothetical protein